MARGEPGGVVASAILLVLVAACGGSTGTIGKVSPDGAVPGSGGIRTSGSGGSSGSGGFGGTMSATGGGPGVGGSAGGCGCEPALCAPGYHFASVAGQCCPVCEPCGPVNCPNAPACPSGQRLITLPGECCPSSCAPSGSGGSGDGGPFVVVHRLPDASVGGCAAVTFPGSGFVTDAGASALCEVVVPPAPSGQIFDPSKLNLELLPVGLTPSLIGRVSAPTDCASVSDGWYYDDPAAPKLVIVCPQTCDAIRSMPGASVAVMVGCATVPAR